MNHIIDGNTKLYLGVDSATKKCCIVETDGIVSKMYATNWCGCDDISRTIKLRKLTPNGKIIKYKGSYAGTDYDCGAQYAFTFEFDELWEVNTQSEIGV